MAAVMPASAEPASDVRQRGGVRAVWESGVKVARPIQAPGDRDAGSHLDLPGFVRRVGGQRKTSLEIAFGAAMAGSRAFCAMKHVGINVASDALMTLTLTGVAGGLVIAVADDVGLSSSQNEQDSRFWGRFAHVPILEPADSQEAYEHDEGRL